MALISPFPLFYKLSSVFSMYSIPRLWAVASSAGSTVWRQLSTSGGSLANVDPREETIYTEEHWEMRQALRKLIDKEINPYVDEWEAAKSFPAHEVSPFVPLS